MRAGFPAAAAAAAALGQAARLCQCRVAHGSTAPAALGSLGCRLSFGLS